MRSGRTRELNRRTAEMIACVMGGERMALVFVSLKPPYEVRVSHCAICDNYSSGKSVRRSTAAASGSISRSIVATTICLSLSK